MTYKAISLLFMTLIPQILLGQSSTIRFDGFPDYDTHLKTKGQLATFQKNHPTIKVSTTFNNHEDHHTRLQTNLATGSGAGDVVLVDVGRLGAYINGGGFIDLKGPRFQGQKLAKDFAPYAFAQGQGADGGQYGIPVDLGPGVLFYRRDYVEGMGFQISEITKSWDTFIEWGTKVKKKHPNVALIADAKDIANLIISATVKEGHGLYFDDKDQPLLTSPRFVKAFETAQKVRKLGLDLAIESWTNEWYEILKNGRVASQPSGAWLLGHLKNWIAPESSGLWGASHLPEQIYGSWGGSFLAIPKQSANPEAAWSFIKFLVTPEAQLAGLNNIAAFPANTKTYGHESFQKSIAYLKGQKANLLFAEIAQKIRPIKPAKGDLMAVTIVDNALDETLNQGRQIQEVLKEAEMMLKRRMRKVH